MPSTTASTTGWLHGLGQPFMACAQLIADVITRTVAGAGVLVRCRCARYAATLPDVAGMNGLLMPRATQPCTNRSSAPR